MEDSEEISRGLAKGLGNKDIAVSLGRDASVIFREITRHGGPEKYCAHRADATARQSRSRPWAVWAHNPTFSEVDRRHCNG